MVLLARSIRRSIYRVCSVAVAGADVACVLPPESECSPDQRDLGDVRAGAAPPLIPGARKRMPEPVPAQGRGGGDDVQRGHPKYRKIRKTRAMNAMTSSIAA